MIIRGQDGFYADNWATTCVSKSHHVAAVLIIELIRQIPMAEGVSI